MQINTSSSSSSTWWFAELEQDFDKNILEKLKKVLQGKDLMIATVIIIFQVSQL